MKSRVCKYSTIEVEAEHPISYRILPGRWIPDLATWPRSGVAECNKLSAIRSLLFFFAFSFYMIFAPIL
mgnify:CR=1 FL=1